MFWFSKLVLMCGILQEELIISYGIPIHEKPRISFIRRHQRVEVPKKNIFLDNFLFKKKSHITKPKETYEEAKNVLKPGNNNNLLSLFGQMNNDQAISPRPFTQPVFFSKKKLLKNIRKGQKLLKKYFKKIQKTLYKPIKHLSILRPHTKSQNCSSDDLFPDLSSNRVYHLDGTEYLVWSERRFLVYCPQHKVCTQKYKSTECFKVRCKNKLIGLPFNGEANIYALCKRKRPPLIFMCPNGFIFHERYQSCLPKCNLTVFSNSEDCENFYKCVAQYQDLYKRYQTLDEKLQQFISSNLYKCFNIISKIDQTSGNTSNSISFESPKPTLTQVTAKITTPEQITLSSTLNVTLASTHISDEFHGFPQTTMEPNETKNSFKKINNNLTIIHIHSEGMDDHTHLSKIYIGNHKNDSQNSPSSDHEIISAIGTASENATIYIISNIRHLDPSSNTLEQPNTKEAGFILYRINDSGASNVPNLSNNKFSISDEPKILNARTYVSSIVPWNTGSIHEKKFYIKTLPSQMQLDLRETDTKRKMNHLKEHKLKYFYNKTLNSTSGGSMNNQKLKAELSISGKNETLASHISRPNTLDSKDFSLHLYKLTPITGSSSISTTEQSKSDSNESKNFMNNITSILTNTLSETIFITTPLSMEFDHNTEQDMNTESSGGANTFIEDDKEEEDSENGSRAKSLPNEPHFFAEVFDMAKNNDLGSSVNEISLHNKEYFGDLELEGEKKTQSNLKDVSNEWDEEMDTETMPPDEEIN